MRWIAITILGAMLALFLRHNSPDMGFMVTLAVCAVVLAAILVPLEDVLALARQMMAWSGLPEDIFTPLIKTMGIGLVCRIGGDLCRDAGQGAMASLVETGGALAAILVCVPLLQAVWDVLQSLI